MIERYTQLLHRVTQHFLFGRVGNAQPERSLSSSGCGCVCIVGKRISPPIFFVQAGETFVTISQHHIKLGNKHDAATNYVDAANCYKKSDPKGKKISLVSTEGSEQ
jgi:hypothetical protein